MSQINAQIAEELSVKVAQIDATVGLLDDGATVPFIARYRKEATGGLDDTQLRQLEKRLAYLRELTDRKAVILKSIADQDKLTGELEQQIAAADSKTLLEELYLPYKPKRRTKGQIAIEAGLEPLATRLLNDPSQDPQALAAEYLNPDNGINEVKDALDGAKYILMEHFAEQPALLRHTREYMWKHAQLSSQVMAGKEQDAAKFSDYFDFSEAVNKVPSHRALAMFRGRNEGFLALSLTLSVEDPRQTNLLGTELIADFVGLQHKNRAADDWLQTVLQWTWRVKLMMYIENELLGKLREQAEADAIDVFATNLKDLLMAAPAGHKATLALDPGLRTGVKVAVVDATGKLLDTTTIYPHAPQKHWDKSVRTLAHLIKMHKVELIAIGNGTASRETDKLAGEVLTSLPEHNVTKVMVSEAGASVYSASEFAANEFPDLDVSLRGAVSIGRRLQDPLAELVKIEPKAIGVGQYQHDVSQSLLSNGLDAVVEDCVNAVGVDLNTASAPLLSRVSGLSRTLAQNIVSFRDQHGAFSSRATLKDVPRLGPKAFEQAAGFLRIANGDNPLDNSAVHPESYTLVSNIAKQMQCDIADLIGASDTLAKVDANAFATDGTGTVTIKDIISELKKPGRDPRPEFKTAQFKDGVNELKDLHEGMILEGVVTNVTKFGAFVDVGVHQDGLVHISAMADKFISDPHEVVKAGDIVKVKVIELDIARKRISFTMRLNESAAPAARQPRSDNKTQPKAHKPQRQNHGRQRGQQDTGNSAMSAAFAAALSKAKK